MSYDNGGSYMFPELKRLIEQMCKDRGIDREIIVRALEDAMLTAAETGSMSGWRPITTRSAGSGLPVQDGDRKVLFDLISLRRGPRTSTGAEPRTTSASRSA
jgi:hypothetical protein